MGDFGQVLRWWWGHSVFWEEEELQIFPEHLHQNAFTSNMYCKDLSSALQRSSRNSLIGKREDQRMRENYEQQGSCKARANLFIMHHSSAKLYLLAAFSSGLCCHVHNPTNQHFSIFFLYKDRDLPTTSAY